MMGLLLSVVLQSGTPDRGKYADAWGSGDWATALFEPGTDLIGALFLLVIALGLLGMVWVISGDMSLPIVVVILLSGVLIPVLPAQAQAGALMVLLGGIAVALYRAWMHGGGARR